MGAEAYNQVLSERRAQAAADFLTTRGIPAELTHVQGLGEMDPVIPNETEADQRENRWVDVAIFASQEFREEARRVTGD